MGDMTFIWVTSEEERDRLISEGWELRGIKKGFGYTSYLLRRYDE